MPEPCVVATAADQNFAMQVAVLVASVSRAMAGESCLLYVLHDGFSDRQRAMVGEAASEGCELAWLSAADAQTATARLPDFLSPATTYRLRLPELIPPEIDQLVYLDADTIVRHSLSTLVATDIGDGLVGAVRDPASPWAAMSLPWRTLGIDPATHYFNAGVLRIPLDRWRSESVGPRAFDLLQQHALRWGDNCALNAVADGQWTELPPRWNVQGGHFDDLRPIWAVQGADVIDPAREDPSVVHFNNPPRNRPWNLGCKNPFAGEWWDLLAATPWSDWRPAELSARDRARLRVKRATAALLGSAPQ